MNAQLKHADAPIRFMPFELDVSELVKQLDACPSAWNRHTMRTEAYQTPHKAVDDIWVRYNAWENFNGDPQAFNGPHESVWYPVADEIPAVKELCNQLISHVGGILGGVLITRIPSGGQVSPHIDHGWHAEVHEKYGIQLKGNADQTFWFEDAQLHPLPGQVYTFDNSRLHAVYNPSDEERITLIVCTRSES